MNLQEIIIASQNKLRGDSSLIKTVIPKEQSDCGNLPLLILTTIWEIATAYNKPRNDDI